MIELKHFTKRYEEFTAVDDISFTAATGTVTGLLGPNGAGKTTILKAMCAIHYPSAGNVQTGAYLTHEAPECVRAITGYAAEQPLLYGNYTAGEFLTFAAEIRLAARAQLAEDSEHVARNRGEQKAAVKNAAERVAAQCAITDVLNKRISTLSKGYKQRLALAQALVHDPEILVLDEPMSGLDPAQIHQMRNLIASLAKGKTIVISTHIMQEIEALCSAIHIVQGGRLRASGSAEDIIAQAGTDTLEAAYLRVTDAENT